MAVKFEQGEATVQTIGADITRNAQRNTYTALPSGVVFSLLFAPWPSPNWTPAAIAQQANYWADIWNQNSRVPGVTGINVTQQTNEVTGNLEDVALVGIVSSSGLSTAQIELGPREWLPSVANTTLTRSFPDAVAAAVAELDQAESVGATA